MNTIAISSLLTYLFLVYSTVFWWYKGHRKLAYWILFFGYLVIAVQNVIYLNRQKGDINKKFAYLSELQMRKDRYQVFKSTTTGEITVLIPRLIVGELYIDKSIKKINCIK